MKQKVLLTILLVACFHAIKAQTEFAPIGATWYYSYASEYGDVFCSYVKYTSLCDTMIEGRNCRLVASNTDTLFFYSEGGKVYNYCKGHFLLTYDFSVQTGDTVSFDIRGTYGEFCIDTFYTVQGVLKNIELKGDAKLKEYAVELLFDDELKREVVTSGYYYMEKVGREYKMLPEIEYPRPEVEVGESHLRCYEDFSIHYISDWWAYYDYNCDYQSSSSIESKNSGGIMQLTPNPVGDMLQIQIESNTECGFEISVTTLDGHVVINQNIVQNHSFIDVSHLTAGVYCVAVSQNGISLDNQKIVKL